QLGVAPDLAAAPHGRLPPCSRGPDLAVTRRLAFALRLWCPLALRLRQAADSGDAQRHDLHGRAGIGIGEALAMDIVETGDQRVEHAAVDVCGARRHGKLERLP